MKQKLNEKKISAVHMFSRKLTSATRQDTFAPHFTDMNRKSTKAWHSVSLMKFLKEEIQD